MIGRLLHYLLLHIVTHITHRAVGIPLRFLEIETCTLVLILVLTALTLTTVNSKECVVYEISISVCNLVVVGALTTILALIIILLLIKLLLLGLLRSYLTLNLITVHQFGQSLLPTLANVVLTDFYE